MWICVYNTTMTCVIELSVKMMMIIILTLIITIKNRISIASLRRYDSTALSYTSQLIYIIWSCCCFSKRRVIRKALFRARVLESDNTTSVYFSIERRSPASVNRKFRNLPQDADETKKLYTENVPSVVRIYYCNITFSLQFLRIKLKAITCSGGSIMQWWPLSVCPSVCLYHAWCLVENWRA